MQTFYDAIGGEPTFRRIVGRFYAEVATDEILRPLYPEADLGAAEERLRLFLMQRWGGPTTYSDTRGHPRLRMRHAPFRIGPGERDAWLRAMRVAIDEGGLQDAHRDELWHYMQTTAQHMVNSPVVVGAVARPRPRARLPSTVCCRDMAIVRLRGQLEKLAGGGSEHQVDGGTVAELLQGLESQFSALEGWILDERGVLRRHVNVFVNGEPAEPDSAVEPTDRIEILPAISGG